MATPDITWFDITSFAPELLKGAVVPGISQTLILSTVNTIVAESVWGSLVTQARVLYGAHMVTLEKRKGLPGATTSRSMGGISESNTAGPLSASFLSLTSYGQLYLTIASTRGFRAGFTTGMTASGGIIRGNGGGWGGRGGFGF